MELKCYISRELLKDKQTELCCYSTSRIFKLDSTKRVKTLETIITVAPAVGEEIVDLLSLPPRGPVR